MDNKLQLFEFNSQPVRVVWASNEPMPILADACKILEIGNPSDVVKRLLFPKGVDSIEVLTKGGRQMCTCISFPNYLDFVARSDKPNAIPFREWVFGEVLPAIFKTGSYSINGELSLTGYNEISHLDLLDDPELLRIAIQFYEDLMHASGQKKALLKGLENEKYPENSFTRGKRKPMDIKFCDISPCLKGRGFSFSRTRVSCFNGGCPTSFRPNGSDTPSTGRRREPLGQNV